MAVFSWLTASSKTIESMPPDNAMQMRLPSSDWRRRKFSTMVISDVMFGPRKNKMKPQAWRAFSAKKSPQGAPMLVFRRIC